MRILVIGNSHLFALSHGWDQIRQEYPEMEVHWLYAAVASAIDLVRDGALIRTTNPELARQIATFSDLGGAFSPDQFDAILLVGLNFHAEPLIGLGNVPRKVAGIAVRLQFRKSLMGWLFNRIRSASKVPMVVFHSPFNQEDAHDFSEHFDYARITRLMDAFVLKSLGARFCPQPGRTICKGPFTSKAFSHKAPGALIGDDGADTFFPEGDKWHKNRRFGKIAMTHLLRTLDEMSATDQENGGGDGRQPAPELTE